MNTGDIQKETPILPDHQAEERPLFFIMAILSFLTALTLLFGLMGYRLSQSWQQDLSGTMTLQIFESDGQSADGASDTAVKVIDGIAPRGRAVRLSEDETRDLLRPWIGEFDLPEDLPMPGLIRMESVESDVLTEIKSGLDDAGIEYEIDDHSVWRKNIQRSWRTAQFGLLAIILLILAASTAISSYATQSVLRARQNIIDVLNHVGAEDGYIAKLFVSRFLTLGLKAAIIGALTALVAVLILGLFSGFLASTRAQLIGPQVSDLFFLAILTLIMSAISGITAGHITRSKLRQDRLKL